MGAERLAQGDPPRKRCSGGQIWAVWVLSHIPNHSHHHLWKEKNPTQPLCAAKSLPAVEVIGNELVSCSVLGPQRLALHRRGESGLGLGWTQHVISVGSFRGTREQITA